MKGMFLKIAIAVAAVALCIFAIACQGQGVSNSSETVMDIADKQQRETETLVDTSSDDEGAATAEGVEEWPGQAKGYIGPNGEGSVTRDEYDTEEAYNQAVIDAAAKEVDVPEVQIWEDEEGGYIEGVLVVNFYRRFGELRAREIVEEHGGVWVSSTFAWDKSGVDFATATVYFPDAVTREQLESIADLLKAEEGVRSAGVDGFEVAMPEGGDNDLDADDEDSLMGYVPNDVSASLQYWLGKSGFKRAWEVVRCSGSVEVAVFDSGIDLDHPDLSNNMGTTMPYDAHNQSVLQGAEQDSSGHGTKVAGVVAAVADNGTGVAGASFNAKLIPVRVTASGGSVSWSAVMRAFGYAMELSNTPEAVNMSFGKTTFDYDGQEDEIQELITSAHENCGIVVVSSAGNKGQEGSPTQWPADFEHVFAVGSLNSNGSHRAASTSNDDVDYCACGQDILTTFNPDYEDGSQYGVDSGTSFAAPQVAAAAALLKAQDPNRNAIDIEDIFMQNAKRPSDFADAVGGGSSGDEPDGKDDDGRYGYGALDAAAAVGWTAPSGGGGGSPRTADGTDAGESDTAVGSLGAAYSAQLAAQEGMKVAGDEEIASALADAMAVNPDVFGWLSVPGTNVSLPLCRREGDDSYYLAHAADDSEAPFGAAYVEGANSPAMGDPLTVAYGHTCWNAEVAFTQLHLFGYRPFFDAHDKVSVCLPDRILEYRIAAASVLDNGHILGGVAAAGPGALARLYAAVTDGSHGGNLVHEGVSVSAGDRVLMLSTCSNYGYKDRRFVVTCVLEGERAL